MCFLAAVTKEGNWYVARCLEVEVTSQGRTIKEALELYFPAAGTHHCPR